MRGLATGRHYGRGRMRYPPVPGIDAVARTGDGRLVYAGCVRPPFGTMAERLVAPFQAEVPAGAGPFAIAAGMNPGLSGWMALTARRREVGALGTVLVLGATGCRAASPCRGHRLSGRRGSDDRVAGPGRARRPGAGSG